MNQKELDLYIELADKLNEYRGEWQVGDVQYCVKNKIFLHEPPCPNCVPIPLPIDPADPERIARGEKPRGLWNMVDWDEIEPNIDLSGNINMFLASREGQSMSNGWCPPTEALLLALKEQWRKKI